MFKYIKSDLPASIVVFFVALPLCLGIALASGAPLFSGLIAGIIGGIVVGGLSGSKIGVSGPAAGLAAIVLTAIGTLGGYENFLVAVVLGGIIQLIFGFLKAGIIGYYFPSSVIKGMLTGIGIIIILKQIPHFFGYNANPEGDFAFFQVDGENTFSELFKTLNNISLGATIIGFIGLGILLLWSNVLSKKGRFFQLVQGPLVAVIAGIVYFFVTDQDSAYGISASLLVSVPVPDNLEMFLGQFSFPNFNAITNPEVWIVGFTIALVAIIHGFLLLISVLLIPTLLNKIPLSVLAAVLLIVGYKLAKPGLFIKMYQQGWKQFLPFTVTVLGIVFTDLLVGIGLGLAVGIVVILIKSFQNSHFLHIEDNSNGNHKIKMTLAEEVTFFNKGAILNELDRLPEGSYLELDVRKTRYLDNDIIEILEDFALKAKEREINIQLISERGVVENPSSYIEFFELGSKKSA